MTTYHLDIWRVKVNTSVMTLRELAAASDGPGGAERVAAALAEMNERNAAVVEKRSWGMFVAEFNRIAEGDYLAYFASRSNDGPPVIAKK